MKPSRLGVRLALVAFVLGTAITASPSNALPFAPAASGAESAPSDATSPAPRTEAEAMVAARRAGKSTRVEDLTTETSTVDANPDGTFTFRGTALPERVRTGTGWADIDLTLELDAQGRPVPRQGYGDVVFSAGGTAALATLKRGQHSVSYAWAHRLPKPVLGGASATYRDVFPGVDMVLTAEINGFSERLVVRTPQAAKDPRLAQLDFEISSPTLNVNKGKGGEIRLTDAYGTLVSTSPSPIAWQAPAHGRAALATTAEASDPSDLLPMVHELRGKTQRITPDRAALLDGSVRFPVVIDPELAWSSGKAAWAYVNKNYPTTNYYNSSAANAPVGFQTETDNVNRSLFTMDTSAVRGKVIDSATFRIKEVWAWSCSPRPVELWATAPLTSSGATWNTQPALTQLQGTRNVAFGWSSACPATDVDFSVLPRVTAAAQSGASSVTFMLKAQNETDTYAWKRFDKNPSLSITYHSLPAVPTGMVTNPYTPCKGGKVGNRQVTLYATPNDPDGGTVTTRFQYWKYAGTPTIANVNGTSGVPQKVTLSSAYLSTGTYFWKVATVQDGDASAWSATCSFVVDDTPPSPQITITPPNEVRAGSPAYYTLDARGQTDITAVLVAMDDDTFKSVPLAQAGGTATVSLRALRPGTSVLKYQTKDAAGNISTTVGALPITVVAPTPSGIASDLNDDGFSDLVVTTADNRLCLMMGNGQGWWRPYSASCGTPINHGWQSPTVEARRVALADRTWTFDSWYYNLMRISTDTATNTNWLQILPGEGGGQIAQTPRDIHDANDLPITAMPDTVSLGTADFDGGPSDLVTRDSTGDVFVWRRDATSDGAPMVSLTAAGQPLRTKIMHTSQPVNLAHDMSGDGNADMILRDGYGEMWLYPSSGNATISAAARISLGKGYSAVTSMVVRDFNRDGMLDLATFNTSKEVHLRLATSRYTFGSPTLVTTYVDNATGIL